HRETLQLGGKRFRLYAQHLFYASSGKAPNDDAVKRAVDVLSGRALFEGREEKVFTRIGDLDEGTKIYLDLGDDQFRAIEVTAGGWNVIDAAPVKFRRPRGMRALPEPHRRGSLDELRSFVNPASEDDFTLTVAHLVAALRTRGPYPVFTLHGQHGSGKSTRSKVAAC